MAKIAKKEVAIASKSFIDCLREEGHWMFPGGLNDLVLVLVIDYRCHLNFLFSGSLFKKKCVSGT